MPETGRIIRVKLSSEAAGSIALTQVVIREMPLTELVGEIVAQTGKDEARLRELLSRGTVVSGASRFRWQGWEEDAETVRRLLAPFPDPDPARPFSAAACVRAILSAPGRQIEISREVGAARRLLRRQSFWDRLVELEGNLRYVDYSYRHRADRYRRDVPPGQRRRVHEAAGLLKYSGLAEQVRQLPLEFVEFHTDR
ncbi:MAG: hypothetical protein ACKV22_20385 [Bryobacteraceae bacterium]